MTNIIDRRKTKKGKATVNRKKFLDRYKEHIREGAKRAVEKKSIKDIGSSEDISIDTRDLKEYTFEHDLESGDIWRVLPGNKEYVKGDTIEKDSGSDGSGRGGSDGGDLDDDFKFLLSKDEFIDIYFSDMELPNYIKESFKRDTAHQKRKAGYSRVGIPAKLNIKKTFEQSFARRISTNAQIKKKLEDKNLTPDEKKRLEKKRARFLDDEDIRYDYYEDVPKPLKQAVMFCLMDASGSMGKWHKEIAKKFFILLYLFLEREYQEVEVVFIRHTHEAHEVTEEEFFYSRQSGGTVVSTAFNLADTIIKERYPPEDWNIYMAQASDGDNFSSDNNEAMTILIKELLPVCQYFAYVQIEAPHISYLQTAYNLMDLYSEITKKVKHFNTKYVQGPEDVYPVLKELFRRQK